jgi:hypothetical protein
MRRLGVITAVVGSLVATALSGSAAAAVAVSCGDTVTARVTLQNDLRCAGAGPTVQGPGGVLDLAGHRIIGSGVGVGVTLAGGRVEDGTVTRFATGVGGAFGQISHLQVTRSSVLGIGGIAAGPFTITATTVSDNTGPAMWGGGSVEDSVITRNGDGIRSSTSLAVRRSVIRGNGGWGISGGDYALVLEDSTVSANTSGGVSVDIMYGSTIQRNRITDHPTGPGLDATFWALDATTVQDNVFSRNQIGLVSRTVGPIRNPGTIVGNRFDSNLAAGMWLEDPATVTAGADPHLTVAANTFSNNGFSNGGLRDRLGRPVNDGLHLDVANLSVTVRDNLAVNNADYGIEAYDSVLDGSGNRARGNRGPTQCLGVACS